jgi:hypothetical protein
LEEIKGEDKMSSTVKKIESDDDTLVSESELSESSSLATIVPPEIIEDENIAREEAQIVTK